MFLVSGPALVKAACRAGVIGSFPTANCRTVEELDRWLADMSDDHEARRRRDRARAGAALSEPDRAPLQPAGARRSRRRAAPRGGDRDHVGRLARAGAEAAEGRGLPGAGRRGLGAPCREGGRGRRRRAGAADGGRGRPDRLGQSLRLRARRADILGRHRGDGGRHGRRPGDRRRPDAGLRSRLHGHQVHRHAREPGQGRPTRRCW